MYLDCIWGCERDGWPSWQGFANGGAGQLLQVPHCIHTWPHHNKQPKANTNHLEKKEKKKERKKKGGGRVK